MKIVYVYHSIAIVGGIERIFSEKMNYLADILGYEVYLITSVQGNHPYPYHISNKVKHIDLDVCFHSQYKYKYPFRLWKKWQLNRSFRNKLNTLIKEIFPEIIVGTTSWNGDVVCQLKCDAKKIIESHGARSYTGVNDGLKRGQIINWFYLRALQKWQKNIENKCDVLVALTNGDAKEWSEATRVQVIPNMTTPTVFSSADVTRKQKHAISVGRLEYEKGFDRLINAWKLVNMKHPDWELDIYGGNGGMKLEIEQQISESDLVEIIHLHNPTNDIFSKYRESDFLVLSSHYEGWGLVLVEAMSCGIPCIAFDCPYGPSDIIENGKNGILVKNGDIQGMADAICWMIEHEEERKQMGIAARETSKKYRPEVIMKQWDELFKELVKQ